MATKAKSSVFRHFDIPEKVETNFNAKGNYYPATLSQIQLCLIYISRFSITVWKAVALQNVFVFVLKYICMYLTPCVTILLYICYILIRHRWMVLDQVVAMLVLKKKRSGIQLITVVK